jgi:Tfp pilus assembly protein PilP
LENKKLKRKQLLKRTLLLMALLSGSQVGYVFYLRNTAGVVDIKNSINDVVLGEKDSSKRELKRVILAIESYNLRNKKYPTTLSVLVPEYLIKLPTSSKNKQRFIYSVKGDSFQLVDNYSGVPVVGREGGSSKFDLIEREIASLPDIREIKNDYVYDSVNKRDPFLRVGFEFAEEYKDCEHPLLCLATQQLRLTLVIEMKDSKKAMLETPEGKGYSVEIGTKVGRFGGEVVEIYPDKLLVLEESKDLFGKVNHNTVELRLRSKVEDKTGKKL